MKITLKVGVTSTYINIPYDLHILSISRVVDKTKVEYMDKKTNVVTESIYDISMSDHELLVSEVIKFK